MELRGFDSPAGFKIKIERNAGNMLKKNKILFCLFDRGFILNYISEKYLYE
jgi:hypothetical protein